MYKMNGFNDNFGVIQPNNLLEKNNQNFFLNQMMGKSAYDNMALN
jgi:hypothetical protein